MAFGLSNEGFSRKRLSDIKTELEDSFKQRFGNYINLLPQSVFSNLIGVFADREAEVWELAEAVYNSQYPDTAEGVSLDNVAAITGIVRQPATKSIIQGVCLFGTVGTVVPQGTEFSVNGNPSAKFITDADVNLVAGSNSFQRIERDGPNPSAGQFTIKYRTEETGLLAYNATPLDIQNALNAFAGLSGVSVSGSMVGGYNIQFNGDDGKQPQPALEIGTDTTGGLLRVNRLSIGVAQGQVNVTATEFGPIQALFDSLTVINTPVFGLDRVRNISDAVVGRDIETDLELRQRRSETLQVAGAATPDAIRARLLNITGVTDCIIFENTTMATVDGRPPKAFEAIVAGGDQQEIINEIWKTKPAGIATHGSILGTALDTMGAAHDVKFSRPTNVNVYVQLDLTVDTNFPATGTTIVQSAIIDFINNRGIGNDIIVYPQLIASFVGVPGILDVVVRIGTAMNPTLDNNIIVNANEIAVTDVTKVEVQVL